MADLYEENNPPSSGASSSSSSSIGTGSQRSWVRQQPHSSDFPQLPLYSDQTVELLKSEKQQILPLTIRHNSLNGQEKKDKEKRLEKSNF